jgi:hypothetical protein
MHDVIRHSLFPPNSTFQQHGIRQFGMLVVQLGKNRRLQVETNHIRFVDVFFSPESRSSPLHNPLGPLIEAPNVVVLVAPIAHEPSGEIVIQMAIL